MDMDDAQKYVRRAAALTLAMVLIMAAMIFAGLRSEPGERWEAYATTGYISTVAMIAVCGVALLRYSRTAGLILFAYFLIVFVLNAAMAGRFGRVGVGLLYLYFYWGAIRGSFAYHRLRRESDGAKRLRPQLFIFIGLPVALATTLIMGYGALTRIGVFPSTRVVEGGQLSAKDSAYLLSEGIIRPDEKILLFYSTELFSIANGGSLLTNLRIISYHTVEGDLHIHSATMEEVLEIEIVDEGSATAAALVEILKVDGDWFQLNLSVEGEGDKKFIEEIERRTGKKAIPLD